jgi:predicted Fe-Mo cluster-binding NifX family protein
MRIAITSTGDNLNSKIDKHLARCSYFMVYDSVSRKGKFIKNPFQKVEKNAGIEVSLFLKKNKIKRVITTEVGTKAKDLLEELKVQIVIITDNNKRIKSILKLISVHP